MKATKTMKAMKAAKAMTKGGIVSELASATDMKKSEVSQLLGQLSEIGAKEVKATGKFVIPGLCMIKTRTKPATKAGKRMMFLSLVRATCCAWFSWLGEPFLLSGGESSEAFVPYPLAQVRQGGGHQGSACENGGQGICSFSSEEADLKRSACELYSL